MSWPVGAEIPLTKQNGCAFLHLIDPVLYERLVKRFQSASERTAEGKAKGYGLTLEASLLRGESNLANLKESVKSPYAPDSNRNGGIDDPWDATAMNKEHGLELWRQYLEDRFVKGDNQEFEYNKVDEDESLDTVERSEEQDKWIEDEEPSWVGQDVNDKGVERKGETGVQDF